MCALVLSVVVAATAAVAGAPTPTVTPAAPASAPAPEPPPRVTVAVAPLTTAADPEHQWIGSAIATALVTRVSLEPALNTVTVRQLNAAERSDNIDPAAVSQPAVAHKLGRLLGADLLVTGSYTVRGNELEVALVLHSPFEAKKDVRPFTFSGAADDLVGIEARAATVLAQALGATPPRVTPGAFGTHNLKAWRSTVQAHQVLDWQSLSPLAADPRAELAISRDALARAKLEAQTAAALDPEFGEAWAALGIAPALLGETQDAWRSFSKATALGYGHHPSAIAGAAFVRMRQGKLDDAAKILQSAIARRPGFLIARGYLGELHTKSGQYQDALAVYDAYAAVAPRQPWVLAQRGYVKSKLGDHVGAIADSRAAVDAVPDSASLLIQLASRYIDAGRLVGAEDALRQAVTIFPDETRAYVRLGYVYLLQGRDDQAIVMSEKALVLSKVRARERDRAYAHLNLARAYGHRGETDKALNHLDQAREAGLPSMAEVEKDAKLASLRADPRYKKLVP
jgi:tetratricopeptide (TPR) repeat protein